jgi:poly(3-hydroxybutyrate) depolymerase
MTIFHLRKVLCIVFFNTFLLSSVSTFATENKPKNVAASNEYTLVIEGYDWGPNVSKVIISLDSSTAGLDFRDFSVLAERSTDCMEIPAPQKSGLRSVVYTYPSDNQGKRLQRGNFLTLVLAVAPNQPLASPIQYSQSGKCRGNNWVTYQLTVTHTKSNTVWNKEKNRIRPLLDDFDLTGKYDYEAGKTMSYGFFKPKNKNPKAPLIIWLHGGGEGGTDPSIAIIGNKVTNYVSDEIQSYFGGAYVLAPQCPGAWMHNKAGVMQAGNDEDVYNVGLMALIKKFVDTHPDIDKKRIYVGGCSNGGYMSLKLILKDPTYFAAGYISALAYQSQYITDQQMNNISTVPMWFIQSKDDKTTVPENTVIPVYERLKKAGAKNVHFTFYDHVVDLSGFYGGENYYFNGHWSWIYSHSNHAKLDYDGSPVKQNGRPVSLMEWLAAQSK